MLQSAHLRGLEGQLEDVGAQQERLAAAVSEGLDSLEDLHIAAGALDGKLSQSLANEVRVSWKPNVRNIAALSLAGPHLLCTQIVSGSCASLMLSEYSFAMCRHLCYRSRKVSCWGSVTSTSSSGRC